MSRRTLLRAALALALLPLGSATARAARNPDWTTPVAPFRIADNLYYVGSRDLGAYLITTPAGNILLNANLPSSPALIRRSIEQLGFRWRDTRILLISHAHFDHAGGAAAVLHQTGARFEVMEGDVAMMESGGRTDFLAGGHRLQPEFPAAHVDVVLHDADRVTLGGVTLVAHLTPGHTPGCTTWTMEAHVPGEPAGTLRHVVIVGSWSVLSEYRLAGTRTHGPSYPGIATDYARTFAVLHRLPCDIFLASHGSLFDLLGKLKRMPAEGDAVWIDPEGYQRAVDAGEKAYEAAFERERLRAQ